MKSERETVAYSAPLDDRGDGPINTVDDLTAFKTEAKRALECESLILLMSRWTHQQIAEQQFGYRRYESHEIVRGANSFTDENGDMIIITNAVAERSIVAVKPSANITC